MIAKDLRNLSVRSPEKLKNDPYQMQNNSDVINMNTGYLLLLLRSFETYVNLKLHGIADKRKNCPDYYNMQLENIETMIELLFPKIELKEYKKYRAHIREVKRRVPNLFRKQGGTIQVNAKLKEYIDDSLSIYFEFILTVMNKKKMLTHVSMAAEFAGSQFEE